MKQGGKLQGQCTQSLQVRKIGKAEAGGIDFIALISNFFNN